MIEFSRIIISNGNLWFDFLRIDVVLGITDAESCPNKLIHDA